MVSLKKICCLGTFTLFAPTSVLADDGWVTLIETSNSTEIRIGSLSWESKNVLMNEDRVSFKVQKVYLEPKADGTQVLKSFQEIDCFTGKITTFSEVGRDASGRVTNWGNSSSWKTVYATPGTINGIIGKYACIDHHPQ